MFDNTDLPPASSSRLTTQVQDANLLLDWVVAVGYGGKDGTSAPGPDQMGVIRAAAAWLQPGANGPGPADEAAFDAAYRALSLWTSPVTAQTLRDTDDAYGRPFLGVSLPEAKIWSRKLSFVTAVFGVLAIITSLAGAIPSLFGPDTSVLGHILHMMAPFTFGGLGACAYLLRSLHTFIYTRQFDRHRIPEHWNRLILGMLAGGTIHLFVAQISEGDSVVKLSAAALGFLAGYNTDFLFNTLERIAAAILPKVGTETVQRAGQTTLVTVDGISLQDLLGRYAAASTDDERKMLSDLIAQVQKRL